MTTTPAEWVPDAPELADVAPDDAMDWPGIEGHLREALPALRGQFAVHRFAQGGAHNAYRVRFGPTLLVVRAPDVEPADLARAHELLTTLPDAYSRAPRALHLCQDGAVSGRPFQVLQYRPGTVIHARLPNAFVKEPDVGGRIAAAVIDALADLHAAGAVHGSFGLARCLFDADPEEGEPDTVTGVLGWDAASASGDPRDDLRSLVATWPGARLGLPDAAELVERYAARTGISITRADLA